MQPPSRFPGTEFPGESKVARGEQLISTLGEQFLVQRLHRVLDESGIAGHRTFCDTLLPYLEGLVVLLPRLAHEGARSTATEAVEILNTMAQENGVAMSDAMAEGIGLHDWLRFQISAHGYTSEWPLITSLGQLSAILLESARQALATSSSTSPKVVQVGRVDEETGLASLPYFEERFGEEILRAQRLEKVLTLIVVDVERSESAIELDAGTAERSLLRGAAAAMLAQTRGFDLATNLNGNTFALLLPETERDGAAALLKRFVLGSDDQQLVDPQLQFKAGIAVFPKDGKTVHELMQHARAVLANGTQSGDSGT